MLLVKNRGLKEGLLESISNYWNQLVIDLEKESCSQVSLVQTVVVKRCTANYKLKLPGRFYFYEIQISIKLHCEEEKKLQRKVISEGNIHIWGDIEGSV